MGLKLFVCYGEVSKNAAYLFINVVDLVVAISQISYGYYNGQQSKLSALSIFWLVFVIGSLIYFKVKGNTQGSIQYAYMIFRFFCTILYFIMISILLSAYLFLYDSSSPRSEASNKGILIYIGVWLLILYDLYLSFVLYKAVKKTH